MSPRKWWQNEPVRVTAGIIAIYMVVKASFEAGGKSIPTGLETAILGLISAWVALLREQVTPTSGSQNATVAAVAQQVKAGEVAPDLKKPTVE